MDSDCIRRIRSPSSAANEFSDATACAIAFGAANRTDPAGMRRRAASVDGPYAKHTERQLRDALKAPRDKYNRFSPHSRQGLIASGAIDNLYEQFRQRGLTIPSGSSKNRNARRDGEAA